MDIECFDRVESPMIDVRLPHGDAAPLVLDSPHSGTVYPDDFHAIVPNVWLRQTEDCYVDELVSLAPTLGATLLKASFSRNYVDVNRAMDDLDPMMIEGVLPFALEPTERTVAGVGLVRHLCRGKQVYAAKLSAHDIQKRLKACYLPYHEALKKILDDMHKQFGNVWHINCHSMPSNGASSARPDFILGDRDGRSSDPGFTGLIADTLKQFGYSVAFNDPYKGVEILRRYGHPRAGFHSVQLEINRALYMNEETLERTGRFSALRNDLGTLVLHVTTWIKRQSESEQLAAE